MRRRSDIPKANLCREQQRDLQTIAPPIASADSCDRYYQLSPIGLSFFCIIVLTLMIMLGM